MNILILAPFEQACLQTLSMHAEVTYENWMESQRLYAPEELTAKINERDITALVVEADFVLEDTFEEATGLELVGICRNATDHIDLNAANQHGVAVVNSPGRNSKAVAELVIGLMFSLSRRIPAAHIYVTAQKWQNPISPYLELRGTEVIGKTLGILGLGTIGSEVAKIGKRLGMKVIANDPFVPDERANALNVSLVDFDFLLENSDFVTIHIPSGLDTSPLIDHKALCLMKSTAFLINTSANEAISEDDLQIALEKKSIGGAALDVHHASPIAPDHPFINLDNIILTPHIGGATDGTIIKHSRMMTEDIMDFLNGKMPSRIVNPSVWRSRD